MYELKVISEDGRYWLEAMSEKKAELHLLSFESLKELVDAIKIVLRQDLDFSGTGFKITKYGGTKYTLYVKSGYSYLGFHLSKSKLTAFRNQLIGVLNG